METLEIINLIITVTSLIAVVMIIGDLIGMINSIEDK